MHRRWDRNWRVCTKYPNSNKIYKACKFHTYTHQRRDRNCTKYYILSYSNTFFETTKAYKLCTLAFCTTDFILGRFCSCSVDVLRNCLECRNFLCVRSIVHAVEQIVIFLTLPAQVCNGLHGKNLGCEVLPQLMESPFGDRSFSMCLTSSGVYFIDS